MKRTTYRPRRRADAIGLLLLAFMLWLLALICRFPNSL
jgi:hypothetical protein